MARSKIHDQVLIMQEDIKHIKDDILEIKDVMKNFIEQADKKYAGKWVEKILWSVGGVAGTIIVGAILKQIIK